MSHDMRFPTMWYVRPAKAQTSLHIRADWSEHLLVASIFLTVKLLTELNLEFLSLKGGLTGSSKSTHVKMPHCWKSHVVAQMFNVANRSSPADVLGGISSEYMVHVPVNVRKNAKIRSRYNQVPHLTQGTAWESDKNTRKHHIQQSQGVSPFPAGDHRAAMNRQNRHET